MCGISVIICVVVYHVVTIRAGVDMMPSHVMIPFALISVMLLVSLSILVMLLSVLLFMVIMMLTMVFPCMV